MRAARRSLLAFVLILGIAALFRAWLIASDGVSFDSDEAVVGLMARHITQGKTIPTFYYGQDYMGSLDALLVAGGFEILGESVQTIRIVQAALYLLSLGAAYALAYEITRSRRVALMALLLLAIPTALGALYTTITLGGYNEVVLLGSLIGLFGWQVTVGQRREAWRWLALGLAAGIGWWVNGAIVTPLAVIGLIGLRYFSARHGRGYALAALAFLIGSAPWWLYNFRHDWAALKFLTGGFEPAPGVEPISPGESLIGLLILGLPALYGLRFPWQAGFALSLGVGLALLVYLALITDLLAGRWARQRQRAERGSRNLSPSEGAAAPLPYGEGKNRASPPRHRVERGSGGEVNPEEEEARLRAARRWVWGTLAVFAVIFTFSSFSDATGRYLMPVWVPAAIGVALGLDRLRRAGRMIPAVALAVLLVAQAGSVIRAAKTDTGLTPQLVERLRTPAEADRALLDFLADEGYTHGYASYWTSFRLIFRAHEAVIFDTALPYDDKGYHAGNDRYPPYRDMVSRADRVVWVTQHFPALDAVIARRLAEAGITCQTHDFGPYRVYVDFSARVSPADLGLDSSHPLKTFNAETAGTPE